MKTLISLFDYTGNACIPYEDNGWQVLQIDLKLDDLFTDDIHSTDILTLNTDWFYDEVFDNCESVDGLIAAPPCTWFAQSGSQRWKKYDEEGKTKIAIELVYQVLRAVELCSCEDQEDENKDFFWYIENPVGRINSLMPEMKQYGPRYFQPYWYGDPYSKKTGLWGKFNMPEPTNMVEPVSSGTSESSMDYYWRKIRKVKYNKANRAYYRSITPDGFAQAFYNCNH